MIHIYDSNIADETFKLWLKEHSNYRTLDEWSPSLIQPIIDRHPSKDNKISGFLERIITGNPGYGKSTFAYKFMAKLYYEIMEYSCIDDEADAYRWSLDNMIYRPMELFERVMHQRDVGEPAWCWCLDDASIHMGRQLFDQDRPTYRKLQGIIPTLREDVTCLLITTPTVQLLAKPFREFFNYKVEMTLPSGITKYTRLGKHYEKRFYPDDVRYRIHHPYDDKFSCLIPEPFYQWYLDKKRLALKEYARDIIHKDFKKEEDEKEDGY